MCLPLPAQQRDCVFSVFSVETLFFSPVFCVINKNFRHDFRFRYVNSTRVQEKRDVQIKLSIKLSGATTRELSGWGWSHQSDISQTFWTFLHCRARRCIATWKVHNCTLSNASRVKILLIFRLERKPKIAGFFTLLWISAAEPVKVRRRNGSRKQRRRKVHFLPRDLQFSIAFMHRCMLLNSSSLSARFLRFLFFTFHFSHWTNSSKLNTHHFTIPRSREESEHFSFCTNSHIVSSSSSYSRRSRIVLNCKNLLLMLHMNFMLRKSNWIESHSRIVHAANAQ